MLKKFLEWIFKEDNSTSINDPKLQDKTKTIKFKTEPYLHNVIVTKITYTLHLIDGNKVENTITTKPIKISHLFDKFTGNISFNGYFEPHYKQKYGYVEITQSYHIDNIRYVNEDLYRFKKDEKCYIIKEHAVSMIETNSIENIEIEVQSERIIQYEE